MAIFSNRTLQRVLTDTTSIIPRGRRREYVRDLNQTVASLDVEWELALIWAFSRITAVEYEPQTSGTSKPDLGVRLNDKDLAFVADIRTISDKGIEMETPMEEFQRRFHRISDALGLRGNAFFIKVDKDDARARRTE